jgi:hypothetical protein
MLVLAAILVVVAVAPVPESPVDETPASAFRAGNAAATKQQWDEAIAAYDRARLLGARSPALYWNWSQAAISRGSRGQALWALRRAEFLDPRDRTIDAPMARVSAALGLDPSETSLGSLGELGRMLRRVAADRIALGLGLVSLLPLVTRSHPLRRVATGAFLLFAVTSAFLLLAQFADERGVVIAASAPLLDAPREDALVIAKLREGEVVPILEAPADARSVRDNAEAAYVRIQDASGARGYARLEDVRAIVPERIGR